MRQRMGWAPIYIYEYCIKLLASFFTFSLFQFFIFFTPESAGAKSADSLNVEQASKVLTYYSFNGSTEYLRDLLFLGP